MLKICIPGNNIAEREYIIKILLSDYLGLEYNIIIQDNNPDYTFSFGNSELVFRDNFFKRFPDPLSYLSIDALPGEIIYVKNDFTIENDIPVIYGSKEFSFNENNIICGIDIFASAFFMLTRWEENVNLVRDEHNRFPATESMALKNNFLHRPVVNEYIELLWNLLRRLGFAGERKKKSFELVLTHDIDYMDYPGSLRIILGDILKRRNLKLAWNHLNYYIRSGNNPYDTFSFIMDISDKLGVKSHFYFMSSNSGTLPDTWFYLTSKRFRKKINEVRKRGHIIGFHPGYFTYDNHDNWRTEKERLDISIQSEVNEGRQHYLRFDVPGTFRIWEKNKMTLDSTMGYAQKDGFRCGTGDIFNIFDFQERKMMNLKECPLIIMDGTLRNLYSLEKAWEVIKYYIESGKKYNSTLTLLFHNATFYAEGFEGYDNLYSKLLELN